jgi:hypothetical protein
MALKHSLGELTPEDIFKRARKEKVQVWGVFAKPDFELQAVAVTEVVKYEQYSSLRVITLGGVNMDQWAAALDQTLEGFCRTMQLSKIEAVGRKGLEVKLKPLGFRPVYTVFVKEVEQVEQNCGRDQNCIKHESSRIPTTIC